MSAQICITGIGICSAIGNTADTFTEHLRSGLSGIRSHTSIFPDQKIWAGLSNLDESAELLGNVDRAALLALQAGSCALKDAFALARLPHDRARVALILGTSHGGRSQIDYCIENPHTFVNGEASGRILEAAPHFRQTEFVGRHLGIHGPVLTISTACSSSSAAILYGLDLLRSHKADCVLAGGMDGFSKLTHSGFRALGAVSDGACAPFSNLIGISLGEGSAVVILERLEDALQRGAHIRAEIYGAGSSWDCYHITEPEPSGDGLLRALEMAACRGNMHLTRDFDYINLHGTGTRANDAAETIALKRFFNNSTVPPASSVKSFTGHTLGASGAMGLIASVLGMQHDFLPPTVNYRNARPGCDLDYVPNHSREANIHRFCTQSAGFGGVNVVVVGGRQRRSASEAKVSPPIAVSGVGIVSAAGIGMQAFRDCLLSGRSGIAPIARFDVSARCSQLAGMVRDFQPRKIAPTLDLRRVDLGFQFAAVAVAEALASSQIAARGIDRASIGLVVGTARGAVNSFEHSIANAMGGTWDKTSALHFPNLVMSSLGGYVSKMFKLQGAASTVVCGTAGGLQAIIHAVELLRCNPTQQASVVVVADELSPLFFQLFDERGTLATGTEVTQGLVYDSASRGAVMGEGAAAFVLEKCPEPDPHDGRFYIAGCGMTTDSEAGGALQMSGAWLSESMQLAFREAKRSPADVNLIYGHGSGFHCRDERELRSLARVCSPTVPLSCVLPNTGLAESALAGFSLAAAALSFRHGEAYPISHMNQSSSDWNFVRNPICKRYDNVLLTASSDAGSNGSLLLSRHP